MTRVVVTGGGGKLGRAANETLLSIDKARKLLGYEPRHSWRSEPPGT
jgi:nucleoside-diphosphate-sugar epimerase